MQAQVDAEVNPGLISEFSPWSYVLLGGRKRCGKQVSLQGIPTAETLTGSGKEKSDEETPVRNTQDPSRGRIPAGIKHRGSAGKQAALLAHQEQGQLLTGMLLMLWS